MIAWTHNKKRSPPSKCEIYGTPIPLCNMANMLRVCQYTLWTTNINYSQCFTPHNGKYTWTGDGIHCDFQLSISTFSIRRFIQLGKKEMKTPSLPGSQRASACILSQFCNAIDFMHIIKKNTLQNTSCLVCTQHIRRSHILPLVELFVCVSYIASFKYSKKWHNIVKRAVHCTAISR